MGRGRVEVKRIDDTARRQVTFAKRSRGLLKKAHELAVLCDAQVGAVVFSGAGKLFDYCSPHVSWEELIHRYETISSSNDPLQETDDVYDDHQRMLTEMARLRHERDNLEASLRRQTGEDLSPVATMDDLDRLEQKLDSILCITRERMDELLNHQLDDAHHKVHMLEDQNSFLRRRMIKEDVGQQHHRAAAGTQSAAERMAAAAATTTDFFPEEVSTLLQLWPPHAVAARSFQSS